MAKFVVGEVRAMNDPGNSGACQVRMINYQNDEKNVKDEHLKWCTPLHPITSAATAGVGIIPAGMCVGSRVLCAYLDDDLNEEYPIILGTLGRAQEPKEKGLGKQSDQDSGGKIPPEEAGPDNSAAPGTGIVQA
jgi:hypothetical protein